MRMSDNNESQPMPIPADKADAGADRLQIFKGFQVYIACSAPLEMVSIGLYKMIYNIYKQYLLLLGKQTQTNTKCKF